MAGVLVVASCSQSGLNKDAATIAIQKALDGQKICLPWYANSADKKLVFSTHPTIKNLANEWIRKEPLFGEYIKAGIVEAHPGFWNSLDEANSVVMGQVWEQIWHSGRNVDPLKSSALVNFKLTDIGKKILSPNAIGTNGGLCGGKRVVSEVLNWSEPAADATGVIVSQVIFHATLQDVPNELKAVFNAESVGSVKGTIQLKKMSDGWVANNVPKLEFIKPEAIAAEPAKTSKLKPELSNDEAYIGTMDCAGKEFGYAIQIKPGEDHNAAAVTSFYPTAKNTELKAGCFASKGVFYGNTGVLSMRFESWIQHPPGYAASNVSAVLSDNEMEAALPVTSCKPFILVRAKLPQAVAANCKNILKE